MADIDIHPEAEGPPEDEYSMLEVALWVLGILMIPGVPILMVYFFTPYSGF